MTSTVHLGIDLGTLSCRVAESVPTRHMPTVLRNALANEATPTALLLHAPEGMRGCGEAAMGLSQLGHGVHDLKKWLLTAPTTTREIGETAWSLSQAVAYLLRVLTSFSKSPTLRSVAVAMPHGAPPEAVAAVEDAGKVLGVNVRCVGDVAATAVYFHHARFQELSDDGDISTSDEKSPTSDGKSPASAPTRVVVVNVGASTVSAALVAASRQRVTVEAEATMRSGAEAIDEGLAEKLLATLNPPARDAVRGHAKSMHKILREARKAKEMLSASDRCGVVLEGLFGDVDISTTLTVDDVEEAGGAFLRALHDTLTALRAPEGGRVECVGGGWRTPCVARTIRRALGVERLGVSLDAALCVAEGASLWSLLTPLSNEPQNDQNDADRHANATTTNDAEGTGAGVPAHAVSMDLPPLPSTAHATEATLAAWAEAERAMHARDGETQRRFATRDALESFVLRTREEIRAAVEEGSKSPATEGRAAAEALLDELEEYVLNDCQGDDTSAIAARHAQAEGDVVTRFAPLEGYRRRIEEERLAKEEALRQAAAAAEQDRELKSDPQRLRGAQQRRDQGVALFKEGQFEDAQRRFVQGLAILGEMYDTSGENGAKRDEISLSCHLNIASCSVKLGLWRNAVNNCTKAMDIQPNHPKALFRRGQARAAMGELDEAEADMIKAEEVSGGDAAVVAALAEIRSKKAAQKVKEKAMYSRMFT